MTFDLSVPVVIVGAGACGLSAALAAAEAGAEVLVLERDRQPSGNTAASTGLIPGAGSRLQQARGIADSPAELVEDVRRKTSGRTDMALVERLAALSGPTIDWLVDAHAIELFLCEGLLYPGHGKVRMHGTRNRTGAELQDQLLNAAARRGVAISTDALVTELHADAERRVRGLAIRRPDGTVERLGCGSLVLACNGFGGNPEMVKDYIPALAGAPYLGHAGNQGDAVRWGLALGAQLADMGSFQGHGAIGQPSGVPMWNTITINGIQVNLAGERFADEWSGYSEQALRVLAQPQGLAWNIFDRRGHALALTYHDYREGFALGAVKQADDVAELSAATGLPLPALAATVAGVQALQRGGGTCRFGRDFTGNPPLEPPFFAARVTGAFLHTQGGLVVDGDARVLDRAGQRLPNLFAGGGAARGLSGPADWGYLSGNGLWTAICLGRLAGSAAAEIARR